MDNTASPRSDDNSRGAAKRLADKVKSSLTRHSSKDADNFSPRSSEDVGSGKQSKSKALQLIKKPYKAVKKLARSSRDSFGLEYTEEGREEGGRSMSPPATRAPVEVTLKTIPSQEGAEEQLKKSEAAVVQAGQELKKDGVAEVQSGLHKQVASHEDAFSVPTGPEKTSGQKEEVVVGSLSDPQPYHDASTEGPVGGAGGEAVQGIKTRGIGAQDGIDLQRDDSAGTNGRSGHRRGAILGVAGITAGAIFVVKLVGAIL